MTPGPKPRPALVVRIGEMEGQPAAAVAYGTSQRVNELHTGEFGITRADGDAFRAAGLSFETKFDLSNIVELPFSKEWFGVPPGAPHGQTPKLGLLHPTLMKRAAAAYSATRRSK